MARIYSSRVLIDPSLLSTVGRATEDRIRMENERRRNAVAPFSNLFSKLGSEIDNYRAKKAEEDKQAKRYADVTWQSSKEQMDDPMYRAAVEEYSRTGSSQPISAYWLSRETAEANRLERARAAAEKEELERKELELKKAQALPQYQEAMRKFNEELDKPVPNYELAAQYQAQADALNKEYEFGTTDLEAIKEAKKKTAEARAKQAAEDAELEEIGARNLAASEAAETDRQYRVAEFLATLPNTFANDDATKTAIDAILANPDMTKEEKTEEMKRIVAIETGTTAAKKAVQGAYASAAGKKAEKKIEETDELKKIRDKQSKGIPLSSRERKILNEAGGK